MNTFKMKVLLFIVNNHLWRSVGRALLIWLLAGTGGGILLKLINGTGYEPYFSEMISLCALGLIFSTPALIIAVPVLYLVHRFETTFDRIVFSAFTIIATCTLLVLAYQTIFGLPATELAEMVAPFLGSALGAYFLIMRKAITKFYPA